MDSMRSHSKYFVLFGLIAVLAGMLVYKYVLSESPASNSSANNASSTVSTSSNGSGAPKPGQYFDIDPQKPVWLLFRSTTCAPCVALQKTMDELQPEFEGKVQFIAIDVNAPANRTMLGEYKIMYIPTTYLFDRNQEEWAQFTGARSTEEMREMLTQLAEAQ